MDTRSSRSIVTFTHSFSLPGYPDDFPAGEYGVVVEEETLQGLSFEAYRRTATYLIVHGKGGHSGHTEMHPTTEKDLEATLGRDRAFENEANASEAALKGDRAKKRETHVDKRAGHYKCECFASSQESSQASLLAAC